jgi:hypothetical protein
MNDCDHTLSRFSYVRAMNGLLSAPGGSDFDLNQFAGDLSLLKRPTGISNSPRDAALRALISRCVVESMRMQLERHHVQPS